MSRGTISTLCERKNKVERDETKRNKIRYHIYSPQKVVFREKSEKKREEGKKGKYVYTVSSVYAHVENRV